MFHWGTVALFVTAFVTADRFDAVHEFAGYGVLALLATRVLWGFVGPRHARFSSFVKGPGAILAFLKQTLRLKAPRYLGHNPAGGAMAIALMVALAVVATSGASMTLAALDGVKWLEALHEGAVGATLALVGLHLVGVLVASLEHGENLVRAMITGRKRA
jgi:cytochrome b